jgi:hypothetical protein
MVGEEGLAPMWQRHLAAHQLLWQGLRQLGLEPYVADPKDSCRTGNERHEVFHCDVFLLGVLCACGSTPAAVTGPGAWGRKGARAGHCG